MSKPIEAEGCIALLELSKSEQSAKNLARFKFLFMLGDNNA